MKNWFQITLLFCTIILFTACNGNGQNTPASSGQPSSLQNKRESRGTVSFKLNGQFFEADPAQAKAWTGTGIPLALMQAKNDKGLFISMQMPNFKGEGAYKLDSDRNGGMSITVNGKDYGIRSVMKDAYINVVITGIKTLGPVFLLAGSFEGVLQDKDGNKVQITEGRFTTERL